MSSTLIIRRTPQRSEKEWAFKLPVKGWIASLCGGNEFLGGGQTFTAADLGWFEGVLAAGNFSTLEERRKFNEVVEVLREGGTIDVWLEG